MIKVTIDKDLEKNLTEKIINDAVEEALKMDCPNCGKKGLIIKKKQIYCPNCKNFIPLTLKLK